MISREEARAAVLEIAEKNGYIDDLTDELDPSLKAKFDKRFSFLETLAARSISTLAKQLYGSGARFVFELLQNAEDNQFNRARELGQAPFVSFHVYPDRVVIECNEDGFSIADLTAICAVGQSTKSSRHGYIGAKGIGFKSVFIAAWKVHIQSGPFSFKFEHKKGDAGLGMVRPEWVTPDEELDGPLTRMTLSLHTDGDEATLQHEKKVIFDQFQNLERTCLLFLRDIQSIYIRFYNQDGSVKESTHFHKKDSGNNKIAIEARSVDCKGSEIAKSEHYHVTKHTTTGLARSDDRGEEIAADIASTAEIVLAFQLTKDFKPIQKKQQLFAFMPMQDSDFKFHIHSDFDTNANRQDVVTTSRRNLDLLDPIAEAFIKAVLQFCDDPGLCFLWPEFLPLPGECTGAFWSSLYEKIKDKISSSNILKSRTRKDLRKISEVVIAANGTEDSRGVLYLDDPATDPFLSSSYGSHVQNILKNYGLGVCSWKLLLQLLRNDLEDPGSKMKNHSTEADWHSGVAKLFSGGLELGLQWITNDLRKMSLIPLRDGSWFSTNDGLVYLPTCTAGVDLPNAIDLKVLDSRATANNDRKTFFKLLGASVASVSVVRSSINRAYCHPVLLSLNVGQSRAHLHFLYLTYVTVGISESKAELRDIKFLSQQRRWTYPSSCYLPGDSSYGPKVLLEPENSAPGFDVPFLHEVYLNDVPEKPSESHPSWEAWLCDFLGAQQRLKLISPERWSLSEAAKYVAQHRPEKFLGLLQYSWILEGKTIIERPALLKAIKSLPADKFCGPNFPPTPSLTLGATCVPSPQLRSRADQYMEDSDSFPFLLLEDDQYTEQLSPKWSFLSKNLKIHHTDDILFLSLLLIRIRGLYEAPSSVRIIHKICELYVAIEASIKTSPDQSSWRKYFRDIASNKSFILVPSQVDGEATWSGPSNCVWRGPSNMVSKSSLRFLYSRILARDEIMMLDEFFSRTLEIQDASTAGVIAELKTRKQSIFNNTGSIRELYVYLDRESRGRESKQQLRQAFDREALIYVSETRKPGWYRASECLWTSTTEIRGKAILDGEYEELKHFFEEKLGVRSLTLQMVYDELLSTTSSSDVQDAQSAVFSFNAFLQTEQEPLDARKILEACIFPIRYPDGSIRLGSAVIDFAIGDRDYLLPSFADRIKILSYTMEEVRRLTPFFEWIRLQRRYLSTLVKEETSVAEGAQGSITSTVRDLRLKAHYILRIAATFDSPRYLQDARGLYRRLLATEVIEAERILAVLVVEQDKKPFKVAQKAGDDHIEDTDAGLKIYVPMDKEAQDVSYGTTLPRKLAEWLMRNEVTHIEDTVHKDAVFALTLVLNMDRSALHRIFERQGIIQVPIPDEDEEPPVEEIEEAVEEREVERTENNDLESYENDERPGSPQAVSSHSYLSTTYTPQGSDILDSEDNASAHETLIEEVSAHSGHARETAVGRQDNRRPETVTPTDSRVDITENAEVSTLSLFNSTTNATVREGNSIDSAVENRSRQMHGSQVSHPSQTSTTRIASGISTSAEEAQYRILLSRVVAAARQAEDPLPARGTFDMSGMRDALPGSNELHVSYDGVELLSRFRSSNQLERDKKIGAAGELFVFEILSNQRLPNWGRENWQSNIRHYVTVHQDYTLLQPWRHRETTDIVYPDTEGRLTEALIDKGYLGDRWIGATPKYFIEVKTTTGPCNTPFYMSGGQYQLMQRVHNSEGVDEVYLIIRVFRINERPRVCIFIDPEELRQNGQLLFTGQTWSVVPGTGASS